MNYYFSAATGGFYSDQFHGPREIAEEQTEKEKKAGKRPRMLPNPDTRVPADAIVITQERWEELMQAQAAGKVIQAVGGRPVAVDAQPNAEALAAARRKERDRRLAASDWTQMADSPLDAATKLAWAEYRQQLRDLDMAGTDWPVEPGAEAA